MTTRHPFNFDAVDSSWHSCLNNALDKMDKTYLNHLYNNNHWLPGAKNIFNAFSLPVAKVNYILFGESPYPRAESANGYAFWDEAVSNLWSPTGLSKAVNRATSLRNIIKMLLVTEGLLNPNQTTQPDIAKINKTGLITSNHELFTNFLNHGFLLLNATLVLQPAQVRKDAVAWHPFIKYILDFLFKQQSNVQLVLFGSIANTIDTFIDNQNLTKLYSEHPYNLSFIHNQKVKDFFKPLRLLNVSSIT